MHKIFDQTLLSSQALACSLIARAQRKGTLSHAYLLTGRNYKDKERLANQFACYLNCTNKEGQNGASCLIYWKASQQKASMCQGCHWLSSYKHPQAWLILSGADTKTGKIPVERARSLQEELSKTSSFIRFVIVPHAQEDILHRPAANALLKTLEEPGSKVIFMLFAPTAQDVLPTVVSRCQTIPLLARLPLDFWLPADEFSPSKKELWQEKYQEKVKTIQVFVDEYFCPTTTNYQTNSDQVLSVLKLTEQLLELKEDDWSFYLTVDLLAYTIIERLRARTRKESAITRYLNQVLSLAEKCKYEIEHYVTPRTAIESMLLSLSQLKGLLEGELIIEHR